MVILGLGATREPRYLYDKLVGRDTGHETRALHGGLRAPAAPRLSLARSAWRHLAGQPAGEERY